MSEEKAEKKPKKVWMDGPISPTFIANSIAKHAEKKTLVLTKFFSAK